MARKKIYIEKNLKDLYGAVAAVLADQVAYNNAVDVGSFPEKITWLSLDELHRIFKLQTGKDCRGKTCVVCGQQLKEK